MFSRILVPLDGSVRAEVAIEHGVALAKQFEGSLTLLRAIELVPESLTASDVIDKIREEQIRSARSYLDQVSRRAAQGSAHVDTVVLPGDPARTILNFAREKDVDVIVINSHGSGGLTGYVFGSVAEKVVRGATCPVLVLHERPSPEELREQEEREEAEFDAMLTASLTRGTQR